MYVIRISSNFYGKIPHLFLHVSHIFHLEDPNTVGLNSYFSLLHWSGLDIENWLLLFLPFLRTLKRKIPFLGFLYLELCGGITERCHLKWSLQLHHCAWRNQNSAFIPIGMGSTRHLLGLKLWRLRRALGRATCLELRVGLVTDCGPAQATGDGLVPSAGCLVAHMIWHGDLPPWQRGGLCQRQKWAGCHVALLRRASVPDCRIWVMQ